MIFPPACNSITSTSCFKVIDPPADIFSALTDPLISHLPPTVTLVSTVTEPLNTHDPPIDNFLPSIVPDPSNDPPILNSLIVISSSTFIVFPI